MLVFQKVGVTQCDICGAVERPGVSCEDIIVESENGRMIRIVFQDEQYEDSLDVCKKCSDYLLEKALKEVRHEA